MISDNPARVAPPNEAPGETEPDDLRPVTRKQIFGKLHSDSLHFSEAFGVDALSWNFDKSGYSIFGDARWKATQINDDKIQAHIIDLAEVATDPTDLVAQECAQKSLGRLVAEQLVGYTKQVIEGER